MCRKIAFFLGPCRNITIQGHQGQGVPGVPCRAIFSGREEILIFGEIFTSGGGVLKAYKRKFPPNVMVLCRIMSVRLVFDEEENGVSPNGVIPNDPSVLMGVVQVGVGD